MSRWLAYYIPAPAGGDLFTVDVAGAITPTGALVLLVNKVLTGSITPTGLLTSLVLKLSDLTGSITPSGALTNVLIEGAAEAVEGFLVSVGSKIMDAGRRMARRW